jgi:hypothetical protein
VKRFDGDRPWGNLKQKIVLAANALLATAVAERRKTPVAILDPSACDTAATFFALLLDYLARRYRFSIKETRDSNGFAGLWRIGRVAMIWPALSNFCSVRVPRISPGRC